MRAIIGVIVAAGRGRRLGGSKQLLPCRRGDGEQPLVACAFDSIAPFCAGMVVVAGHDAERVLAALGPRRFHAVRASPEAEMIESVRAGARAARGIDPEAAILLQPGDHPRAAASTLRAMAQAAEDQRAVIPTWGGRGGHPVLIPPELVEALLAYRGPGGVGGFWRERPGRCLRLPVEDPTVLQDLDTPRDLR